MNIKGANEGDGGLYIKADAFYNKQKPVEVIYENGECNSIEIKTIGKYIDIGW